jgi:SAM-dependent methyltransferase
METSKYDDIGQGYSRVRREDPSIGRLIWTSLRDCRTVLNVGAGTGSYEPRDRFVVAVERSALMIQQRVSDAAPAVQADALELPFPDDAFEASLAVLTIHHWKDWKLGLRELVRVSSKRTVILTWFASAGEFWLHKYFPELLHADTGKFPDWR